MNREEAVATVEEIATLCGSHPGFVIRQTLGEVLSGLLSIACVDEIVGDAPNVYAGIVVREEVQILREHARVCEGCPAHAYVP